MTIKELIEKYGGVPEFRRMLEKKHRIYKVIPSPATLYFHLKTGKVKSLKLKDMYKDLGVTDLKG